MNVGVSQGFFLRPFATLATLRNPNQPNQQKQGRRAAQQAQAMPPPSKKNTLKNAQPVDLQAFRATGLLEASFTLPR